jgi:type IV secretory pathway TrbL component
MIPLRRFAAINLCGILIAPKGTKLSYRTVNHEAIHTAQMKEMLFVFFYLWYLIEWLIRLFCKGNAYRNIAFEKEAYQNDHNKNYLNNRKHYSWFKLF